VEKGGGKPLLPNSKRRAFICTLVICANWIKYAVKWRKRLLFFRRYWF